MKPTLIGEDLLACDSCGRLRMRIATVFPRARTIITLPGVHATQRLAFAEMVSAQRVADGFPALSDDELDQAMMAAVDLVIDNDCILIRPDPADMALAFEADDLLQEIVSKKRIKFLHVLNPRVREAIQRHGERWRISALPRSQAEMQKMIVESRIGIGGRDIFYYNKTTGTRIITCQEFSQLAKLSAPELRRHLQEIQKYAPRVNRSSNPEIVLFQSHDAGLVGALAAYDFEKMSEPELRSAHAALERQFRESVPLDFRRDDVADPAWRSQMYAELIGHTDKEISEESLLGLAAEFFMQVEWLPGGRMEEGEFIVDPVLEEEADQYGSDCPSSQLITDEKARGFIFNIIRDYGNLDFVNIGRVVGSLSTRKPSTGRRGVYVAEFKHRDAHNPILRIIRMQKWGVREHLDEGKDLLSALLESEAYTEYILDRRLGCRQLGMNLPQRVAARKVSERYAGCNGRYRGRMIYAAYFERDYMPGLATDKIPANWFADEEFALPFARVLGRAAAPNVIVGRSNLEGDVIFDDGDELVIQNQSGVCIDVMVADHTGTFQDYRSDLLDLAGAYMQPIAKRMEFLRNVQRFTDVYLEAFVDRFAQIQAEYRRRRRAFDTLFHHEDRDEAGSFAYRWEQVLRRLDVAKPKALADRIRDAISCLR